MRKLILFLLFLCPLVQAEDCFQKEMDEAQLNECAKKGSVQAQYTLGAMYYQGKTVPQDYEKAVKWYSKAAAQGDEKAQFNLGWIYHEGHGVTKDDKKSFEWYLKAAEQGEARAQYNAGWMYAQGIGVKKDSVLGYMWINLSAKQGVGAAANVKEILTKEMTPEQITAGETLTEEWLAKNAQPTQP